jgi:hypothetical protein
MFCKLCRYRSCHCNRPTVCGEDVSEKRNNNFKCFPDNRKDFDYYCQNLGIKDIDASWLIHSQAEKHNKLLVSTKHFFPIDVDDSGQVINRTRYDMGRGCCVIGKPETLKLPCPAASLDDLRGDFRNLRKTKSRQSSEGVSASGNSRNQRSLKRSAISDDTMNRWYAEKTEKMSDAKQRRLKFIAEEFKKNSDIILALRSICPIKNQIDADSDITEGDVPIFIKLGTRPPYPFDFSDTVALDSEMAVLLARLRVMARDINTNKLNHLNKDDNIDDEDDISELDVIDIFHDILDIGETPDSDDESDDDIVDDL